MKTKMKRLIKNQKGMTLIELLAVIVIIAIIALIAIPAIGSIINNSKDKAILSDASQIISSAKIAISDGACDGGTSACDKTALSKYVDLETDYDSYTVMKDSTTGKYSIKFSGFAKVKNKDKFPNTAEKAADVVVTAAQLASDMGKK